jgi:hypothetical protein
MKRIALLGLALAALALLQPGQAYAQATRTWVSGVGDDANPCSRTAPCKTFAGAIAKTATFGEINCLDPGGFGAVTITKSITISCEAGTAGVLVSGTNGIVVNVAATDNVYLRGLDFQGLTTGLSGILFLNGGSLHVEKCLIHQFNSSSAGFGINFAPSAASTSELFVSDTVIADNGTGTIGAGLLIAPTGSANVSAVMTRVRVENNSVGLKASGDGTSGKTNVEINDTQSSGSAHSGFVAETGAGASNGPVTMVVNSSVSSHNHVGVQASGTGALLLLGNSAVTTNDTGVLAQNNGVVQSYKNNQINGNTTDGTPVTAVPNGPLN